MSLRALVKQRALEVGFDLAGIAPLTIWEDLEFSRQWVEKGYGGEMRYLGNPKRGDPRQVLPSAKSVVCVGLIYNAPLPYSTEVSRQLSVVSGQLQKPEDKGQETTGPGHGESPRAWISRYAWGEDYHRVMRRKLQRLRVAVEALAPEVESCVYVDTAPIVERAFARHSGIGWMGKNTCLINQEKGSWFFLGVMLTSLELEPDLPAPDRCGSCTRCIEACPTDALVEPYVMDASRCIAYFTIELRGSIPEQFRSAIDANVFGCDICQDVCPWNSKSSRQLSVVGSQLQDTGDQPSVIGHQQAKAETGAGHRATQVATTAVTEFQPLQLELTPHTCHPTPALSLFNPPLEALASLSEEDFRRVFAHSPLKRAKYRGWLRNLCVAMGNSGDPRFLPWLERAREHPESIIREHAEWALRRLTAQKPAAEDLGLPSVSNGKKNSHITPLPSGTLKP